MAALAVRSACASRAPAATTRTESRGPGQTLFLCPSSSSTSQSRVASRPQQAGWSSLEHGGDSWRSATRVVVANSAPAEAANLPSPRGPPGDEASKNFALAVAKVIDDMKCEDVMVLDVAPVVSWTSFLVIGTVFSKPQLLAGLARAEKMAAEQFGRGRQNLPGSSPWETLDFGDVVLHLFTAEQREYYDIESFYAAAEEVDLPFGPDAAEAGQQPGSAEPTWSTKM